VAVARRELQRALVASLAVHVLALGAWIGVFSPTSQREIELVDIEMAPPPPKAEALPAEVAKPPEQDQGAKTDESEPASTAPSEPGEHVADAGIDAPPDAAIDAPIDARPKRPDAAVDAAPDAPVDAEPVNVALDDAAPPELAAADAGTDDAAQLAGGSATGPGSGVGSGPGGPSVDGGALATMEGSGSGVPGATDEPAVEGAPTTAGTAANLLAYFPQGHVVTALIRFDRLRNTEWQAQTERLLQPMPDYQLLFGTKDAKISDKLETLVISSPRPRDVTATTLVGRTLLARSDLRDLLAAVSPVTWSAAKGGLLGKRTGKLFNNDKRVFLSPFKGWFLLAPPDDLPNLTAPAKGKLDAIEATGKLPPWLAGIRKIESESGDQRGPALVMTIALGGKRIDLKDSDFGLGITTVPMPDRVSLAMELVKQGWLVRGNMSFASDAQAAELIAAAQQVQQRIADSHAIQLVIGKPVAHVVANLSFARTGPRVSYATSISIADARAILAAAAVQLDQYFGRAP